MSDPRKTDPDADLLEFLGGIDEVNDDSLDHDFSDFLAKTDIEDLEAGTKPMAPVEGEDKK
jgi:hypothetical protein